MKYCTYKAMILALMAVTLGACDHIADDDRFIPLPAVEAKRVVLVEEFTGQNCVNCPEAHEDVARLIEQYPENLIAVSIHGGPLSMSETELPGVGLATADGEAYYNENKVAAPPAAVINRTSGVILKDKWGAAIRDEVAKPTNLDLALTAALGPDGNISVTTDITPYDKIQGNLQLWVVENGIKGLQITPEGFKMDYEHSHVLRATVNGHNGEAVSLLPREAVTKEHTLAPKAEWNTANLEIVAFVYNSQGVLQAAKAKVTQ